jgi:hypothetical protein
MTQPIIPEVRQDQDQASQTFGSIAVHTGYPNLGWGVMNPGITNVNAVGGHWAQDTEVASWAVIQQPATREAEAESEENVAEAVE